MNHEQAIGYLNKFHVNDDTFAMIVVSEKELIQVTGDRVGREFLDRLAELISRTPGNNPDIDHNYWYEQREVFRTLVDKGIDYLEERAVQDAISDSNDKLREELGLVNMRLSLDHEVRPMQIVNPNMDVSVRSVWSEEWFILPKGSTYEYLLRRMDKELEDSGHMFLESLTPMVGDGHAILTAGFGS